MVLFAAGHVGNTSGLGLEAADWFIDFTYNIPTRTEAYKYAAYDALQNLTSHRL